MSQPGPATSGQGAASVPTHGGGAFRVVLAQSELPRGHVRRVEVDGRAIALWNVGGTIYATDDTCTHEKAQLSEGDFDAEGGFVECPKHGARFDVKTGKALTLPAYKPLRTYPVRVEDGQIAVRLD